MIDAKPDEKGEFAILGTEGFDNDGEVVRRHTVIAPNHEVVDDPRYFSVEEVGHSH